MLKLKSILMVVAMLTMVGFLNTSYAEEQVVFPSYIVEHAKEASELTGQPLERILAVLLKENRAFDPKLVSKTDDYGLMQINKSNHKTFKNCGFDNIYDPRQNIIFGAMVLQWAEEGVGSDEDYILMTYNMGGRRAKQLWAEGTRSSGYSRAVRENIRNKDTWVTDKGVAVINRNTGMTFAEALIDYMSIYV